MWCSAFSWQTPEEEDTLNKKRSKKVQKKLEKRRKNSKISPLLDEQFQQGKLLGEPHVHPHVLLPRIQQAWWNHIQFCYWYLSDELLPLSDSFHSFLIHLHIPLLYRALTVFSVCFPSMHCFQTGTVWSSWWLCSGGKRTGVLPEEDQGQEGQINVQLFDTTAIKSKPTHTPVYGSLFNTHTPHAEICSVVLRSIQRLSTSVHLIVLMRAFCLFPFFFPLPPTWPVYPLPLTPCWL